MESNKTGKMNKKTDISKLSKNNSKLYTTPHPQESCPTETNSISKIILDGKRIQLMIN